VFLWGPAIDVCFACVCKWGCGGGGGGGVIVVLCFGGVVYGSCWGYSPTRVRRKKSGNEKGGIRELRGREGGHFSRRKTKGARDPEVMERKLAWPYALGGIVITRGNWEVPKKLSRYGESVRGHWVLGRVEESLPIQFPTYIGSA